MNRPDNPRKALGRGLGALLPTRPPVAPALPPAQTNDAPQTLPVDLIDPNPLQPRRLFQNERLADLAQSIRFHTPGETEKRHGQAVAAASLPSLGKE